MSRVNSKFSAYEEILKNISDCQQSLDIMIDEICTFQKGLKEKALGKQIDGYEEALQNGLEARLQDKEYLNELYGIFQKYYTTMTDIISPSPSTSVTRIDNGEITKGLEELRELAVLDSSSPYNFSGNPSESGIISHPQYNGKDVIPQKTAEQEEAERKKAAHNAALLQEAVGEIKNSTENLAKKIEEIERIYNNKIVPFLEADSELAKHAKHIGDNDYEQFLSNREIFNYPVFTENSVYVADGTEMRVLGPDGKWYVGTTTGAGERDSDGRPKPSRIVVNDPEYGKAVEADYKQKNYVITADGKSLPRYVTSAAVGSRAGFVGWTGKVYPGTVGPNCTFIPDPGYEEEYAKDSGYSWNTLKGWGAAATNALGTLVTGTLQVPSMFSYAFNWASSKFSDDKQYRDNMHAAQENMEIIGTTEDTMKTEVANFFGVDKNEVAKIQPVADIAAAFLTGKLGKAKNPSKVVNGAEDAAKIADEAGDTARALNKGINAEKIADAGDDALKIADAAGDAEKMAGIAGKGKNSGKTVTPSKNTAKAETKPELKKGKGEITPEVKNKEVPEAPRAETKPNLEKGKGEITPEVKSKEVSEAPKTEKKPELEKSGEEIRNPNNNRISDKNAPEEVKPKGNNEIEAPPAKKEKPELNNKDSVESNKKNPINEGQKVDRENVKFEEDPINMVSGSLYIPAADLVLPDVDEEFKFERRYESVQKTSGIFGKGWITKYEINVSEFENRAEVLCEDGHYETFIKEGNQYKNSKKGRLNYSLEKNKTGWIFKYFKENKKYEFNNEGQLTAINSGFGNKLELLYKDGILDKIHTYSNFTIDFEYKDGKVSSISDGFRKINYKYKNDYLTEVSDAESGTTYYNYTDNGFIKSVIDKNGNKYIENEFDSRGRVLKQTFPDGSYSRFIYNDQKHENTLYLDCFKMSKKYKYNDEYLVTEIIYDDGSTEKFGYDDYQNKIYIKDRNGNEIHRKFDKFGNLIKIIYPDGNQIYYKYNENNRISEISDISGRHIINSYDKNNNITIQKIKTDENIYIEEKFSYDEFGRIILRTDALGNKTQYKYADVNFKRLPFPYEVITPSGYRYKYIYDMYGRTTAVNTDYGTVSYSYNNYNYPVIIKDAEDNVTLKEYDNMGNLLSVTTPNLLNSGKAYKYKYNEFDMVVASENPLGAVSKNIRDRNGNIIKEISPKFYNSKTDNVIGIQHIYDKDERLIKNIYEDGGIERFFYDCQGNLIKHISPENYNSKTDDGAGYSYTYDCMNRLKEIINEDGEKEHIFKYDYQGNIIEETNINGNTSYFKYNLIGNLLEKRIPVEEEILNKEEQLCSIRNNNAEKNNKTEKVILYSVTLYEYDKLGNKTTEKHGIDKVQKDEECTKFNEINFEYDSEGRIAKVCDKQGAKTEYRYDCLNNKTYESFKINDEVTKKIHYKYNKRGFLEEKTEELTEGIVIPCRRKEKLLSKTFYEYDADGNLVKAENSEGMQILRNYDEAGRCTEHIEKDKAETIYRKTSYDYDLNDNIIKIIKKSGRNGKEKIQSFIYDDKDRIIKAEGINGGIIRIFYDKNDRVIKQIMPEEYKKAGDNGRGTIYSYNFKNQLTEVTDALGNVQVKHSYDRFGNIISETDALGNAAEFKYNIAGRIKEVLTPESKLHNKPAQSFRYDARGNITGITDGNGNNTEYVLDSWGRISEIHTADGGIEKYTYDYAGNVTSTTDANGGKIEYRYNQFNQPVEIKDQTGLSEYFDYDLMGRLTASKNRNGIITEREYSADGNLLRLFAYKEGNHRALRRRYAYNEEGMVIAAEAPGIVYNYEYTDDGRLKKKSSGGKRLAEYNYDLNGNVKSLKDISGKSTLYNYDVLGRLKTIADENNRTLASYKYLKNNYLDEVMLGNGIKTKYNYDKEGNITKLLSETADGNILADYSYTYDLNGNRLTKTGNRYNNHYKYDSMNRLITADYGNKRETFTYDKVGNRLTKLADNMLEKYSYNVKNQLIKIDAPQVMVPDGRSENQHKQVYDLFVTPEVKKKNSEPRLFEYDNQGNMISEKTADGINIFDYDELNNQVQARMKDGNILKNFFDAEGFRYKINENGKESTFIFNQNAEIITESDEKGIVSRFDRGYNVVSADIRNDKNISKKDNNNNSSYEDNVINLNDKAEEFSKYYYLTDGQGSTDFITDVSGKTVNSYKYDAFGSDIESEEIVHNRIKYTGQQWDNVTQQYYLRARFYNPNIARFTQEDVYRGDGLNLYAYCSNNPIIYYDPSGNVIKEDVPYLFSYDNYYIGNNPKSDSQRLKYNILKRMGVENITNASTGSHQAQHIIPQQWVNRTKNGALLASGFQLDNAENGIFAINGIQINRLLNPENNDLYMRYLNNSLLPEELNNLSLYKNFLNNVDENLINKYVANRTHHGLYWPPFDHKAYSRYVGTKLNEICDMYNIPYKIENTNTLNETIENLISNGKLNDLRKDIYTLVKGLRELHIEGIDLYLQHDYNTGNTNWFNNLNDYDSNVNYTSEEIESLRERTQQLYNKNMNQRLNEKIASFTACSKGDTFKNI